MRLFLMTVLVLFAVPAGACMRSPVAYSQTDQINNEFAFLICLSNEKNEMLRLQDQQIRALLAQAQKQDTAMQLLQRQEQHLSDRISALEIMSTTVAKPQ